MTAFTCSSSPGVRINSGGLKLHRPAGRHGRRGPAQLKPPVLVGEPAIARGQRRDRVGVDREAHMRGAPAIAVADAEVELGRTGRLRDVRIALPEIVCPVEDG